MEKSAEEVTSPIFIDRDSDVKVLIVGPPKCGKSEVVDGLRTLRISDFFSCKAQSEGKKEKEKEISTDSNDNKSKKGQSFSEEKKKRLPRQEAAVKTSVPEPGVEVTLRIVNREELKYTKELLPSATDYPPTPSCNTTTTTTTKEVSKVTETTAANEKENGLFGETKDSEATGAQAAAVSSPCGAYGSSEETPFVIQFWEAHDEEEEAKARRRSPPSSYVHTYTSPNPARQTNTTVNVNASSSSSNNPWVDMAYKNAKAALCVVSWPCVAIRFFENMNGNEKESDSGRDNNTSASGDCASGKNTLGGSSKSEPTTSSSGSYRDSVHLPINTVPHASYAVAGGSMTAATATDEEQVDDGLSLGGGIFRLTKNAGMLAPALRAAVRYKARIDRLCRHQWWETQANPSSITSSCCDMSRTDDTGPLSILVITHCRTAMPQHLQALEDEQYSSLKGFCRAFGYAGFVMLAGNEKASNEKKETDISNAKKNTSTTCGSEKRRPMDTYSAESSLEKRNKADHEEDVAGVMEDGECAGTYTADQQNLLALYITLLRTLLLDRRIADAKQSLLSNTNKNTTKCACCSMQDKLQVSNASSTREETATTSTEQKVTDATITLTSTSKGNEEDTGTEGYPSAPSRSSSTMMVTSSVTEEREREREDTNICNSAAIVLEHHLAPPPSLPTEEREEEGEKEEEKIPTYFEYLQKQRTQLIQIPLVVRDVPLVSSSSREADEEEEEEPGADEKSKKRKNRRFVSTTFASSHHTLSTTGKGGLLQGTVAGAAHWSAHLLHAGWAVPARTVQRSLGAGSTVLTFSKNVGSSLLKKLPGLWGGNSGATDSTKGEEPEEKREELIETCNEPITIAGTNTISDTTCSHTVAADAAENTKQEKPIPKGGCSPRPSAEPNGSGSTCNNNEHKPPPPTSPSGAAAAAPTSSCSTSEPSEDEIVARIEEMRKSPTLVEYEVEHN